MYMVQTLYFLYNRGIGSDVKLYTNPITAIQQAKEAKNKHISECHIGIGEEPEVNEQIGDIEIYSSIVQNNENFWSVTVKEINVLKG
ncbi:hypothetical protein [Bacillus subtilis]|uniref:hypothetical protein n=1 Tax=Bacillus subtilis TaxID=1423 RepID=UPI004026D059